MSNAHIWSLLNQYTLAQWTPLMFMVVVVILGAVFLVYMCNHIDMISVHHLTKIYPNAIKDSHIICIATWALMCLVIFFCLVDYVAMLGSNTNTNATKVRYAMIANQYKHRLPKQEASEKHQKPVSFTSYSDQNGLKHRVSFEKKFVSRYGDMKHLHGPSFANYSANIEALHWNDQPELNHFHFRK